MRQILNKRKDFISQLGVNRPVLALSLARMADAMGNSILIILIPLYVAQMPDNYLGLPVPVLVGLLISLFGFIVTFLQPLMGALSDRIGRRKALIQVGLIIIGISTLSFIMADQFLDIVVLRVLQGLGVALTIPASLSLMSAITQKGTRGGSMGVFSTFRVIGFASGPLVGGFLQTHYGFDSAFYAGAGFILISMIVVQVWVNEVPFSMNEARRRAFKIIDLNLINKGIASAAFATFSMACSFSMVTTLENEFNSRLSITAFGFSIAFSMLMVGRLLFQVPLGRYSDYIGRKPIMIVGLVFMGITTGLMGEVQTLMQFVVLRGLQGIAAAGVAAPAFAVAADLSSDGGEGRQMSMITTGFSFGIAIGPLLAGLLAVYFFELPFLVIGLLAIVGAGIVFRYMPETVEGSKVVFKTD